MKFDFESGCWVGDGLSNETKSKLNSTHVLVEVKVGFELSNCSLLDRGEESINQHKMGYLPRRSSPRLALLSPISTSLMYNQFWLLCLHAPLILLISSLVSASKGVNIFILNLNQRNCIKIYLAIRQSMLYLLLDVWRFPQFLSKLNT